MLQVTGLHKSFKREPVLRGISFVMPPASVLGIWGSNGAGKTTLLHILAAILPPDRGTVTLNGVRPEQSAYRRQIGLVPQQVALSPRLTVRQNLDFWASIRGFQGAERRKFVDEAAEMSNITTFLGKTVGRCSSGMARRVNLAAGIIGRPPLILLDEPTAGIDEENRRLILQAVTRLKQSGCLVLMVNHYHQELAGVCDQVMLLQDGCAIWQGDDHL